MNNRNSPEKSSPCGRAGPLGSEPFQDAPTTKLDESD
jgi:hypothetical protein